MKTNDIKKGTRVKLRNGWFATVMDNKPGPTRMCLVEGICTEMGSVYSHNIVLVVNPDGTDTKVEHTKDQMALNVKLTLLGF